MHNAKEIVAVTRSIRDFRKKIEREENALYLLQYLIFIGMRIGIPFAVPFFFFRALVRMQRIS